MTAKTLALALGLAAIVPSTAASAPVALTEQQELALLSAMSHLPEKDLKRVNGLTPGSIGKVLAFRVGRKEFTSIPEFRRVAGLSETQWELVARYAQERKFSLGEDEKPRVKVGKTLAAEAEQPPPSKPDKEAAPKGEAPAFPKGQPEPQQGGAPGLSVRGGFYSVLPGYDFSALPDEKRRAFLETINREMCPCGCVGETLAWCLVNDPGCPVVKARVRKVYTDVVGEPPPAAPAKADGAP